MDYPIIMNITKKICKIPFDRRISHYATEDHIGFFRAAKKRCFSPSVFIFFGFSSKYSVPWKLASHHHEPRITFSEYNPRHSVCSLGHKFWGNRCFEKTLVEKSAIDVHNILRNHRESSIDEIDRVFVKCGVVLTDGLILNVLDRNRFDWKPAYTLFQLSCRRGLRSSGSAIYNEILDILGKLRRFEELNQVFDEMSKRKGLVDEKTFTVLLNRYSAAHKVEEAIGVYERRNEFGIENDLLAFQGILMWLCRYKHVEAAETLLCSNRNQFGSDIKTMSIILNGWCILGNVDEATRFYNDIIGSKCKPDLFTYGTFINTLTKKGKVDTAMELFREMWKSRINPNVIICNNIFDALCSKKRVREALEVFKEMSERGCSPNVSTYNSLVKHFCKIRKMEKAYKILDEMEKKGGACLPDDITYGYLFKSSKKPAEVEIVLERMKKNGCKMTADLYNLVLKLYMDWDYEVHARDIWGELEKSGLGPDQTTYTIMVHVLYEKLRFGDALRYYHEMVSKAMVPAPRTEIMVNDMKTKLTDQAEEMKRGMRKKGKSLKFKEIRRKKTSGR